jgi:hypothetical protein
MLLTRTPEAALIDAADERARVGEPQGYCPADPASGTGDQSDTTAQ